MKILKNNQAFTLIEVLASITILGIILSIFLSFFFNSMLFSVKTEDKLTAINYADTALNNVKIYMKNNGVPTMNSCDNPETELTLPGLDQTVTLNNKTYNLKIFGCSEEYENGHLDLIRLHVKVFSENHTPSITEQFDYYVMP